MLSVTALTGAKTTAGSVLPPSPPIRMATSLWGPWQATLDPQDKGEREGYFKPDVAAQGWKEVNVPASFATVAPEIDRYEGVGWFRKSFRLTDPWKGWRIVLTFKGVNNHAKVWLNGTLVGENSDAFLPFEVPLDGTLRFDGENVLAIRVDNTRRRNEIPAGGRAGTPTAASCARSRCWRPIPSEWIGFASEANRRAKAAGSRCGPESSMAVTRRPRAGSEFVGPRPASGRTSTSIRGRWSRDARRSSRFPGQFRRSRRGRPTSLCFTVSR